MDNTNNSEMVMIPIKRFEELIRTETRVNVLVERIQHNTYMRNEDILFLLDTDLSVELALDILDKNEKQRQEWAKTVQEKENE
jgi:hypothetical protein